MTDTPPERPKAPETGRRQQAEAVFERRLQLVGEAVDLHSVYLLDYLRGLTRHQQDAENLLQDLWHHVLMHFPEEKISALPILRRKAYQLFIDFFRARQRRGETLSEELPEESQLTPASREAYTDAEEKQLEASFWERFDGLTLNPRHQQALWMHIRYGFTFKEIEDRIQVPSSTVCDWIAKTRSILIDHLNAQR